MKLASVAEQECSAVAKAAWLQLVIVRVRGLKWKSHSFADFVTVSERGVSLDQRSFSFLFSD